MFPKLLYRVDQIVDQIYKSFENNEHSWFLLIYRTTVDHQILLKDLEVYGVKEMNLSIVIRNGKFLMALVLANSEAI